MQNHRKQVRLISLLALAAGVAGCERAAISAPSARDAKDAPAYELVTERRPVSLADYLRKQKDYYELCKTGAEITRAPVKPFVELPKDFVLERVTRSSDGASYFIKQQQYAIDVEKMTPENGCATRLVEAVVIERVRNGVLEHVDIDQDGKRVSAEPMRMPKAAAVDGDADSYTEARTEGGVALKCIPRGAAGVADGVVSEQCIVDPGKGRPLREPDGSLVLAYLREELSASLGGSASILAPVSLTIGKADANKMNGALQ